MPAFLVGRTDSSPQVHVGTNAFYDGTNWKYVSASSAQASRYYQGSGQHIWETAVAGTSGNNVSFTQAMTLDASGNLGVGVTPEAFGSQGKAFRIGAQGTLAGYAYSSTNNQVWLANNVFVKEDTGFYYIGSNPAAMLRMVNTGELIFSQAATGTAGNAITLLERFRVNGSGYFKASNDGTYYGATGTYHEFRTTAADNASVVVRSSATSGNQYGMYVSTANDQNDTTRYFISCEGSSTERVTLRSNGGIANYSANNVNLASDERLKKDIAPLASTWDKLKGIEVVNFRYKDCNEGDPALYGVIAQQVQPIVPELVVVTREAVEAKDAVLDEDGNEVTPAVEAAPEYYGIREQPMYWLAIKALQEAQARIEALEVEVAALKAGA
jgi:hypothetical protein